MNNKNMDPLTLIKFLEIMDVPFDKECSCGEKHRLLVTDFDLNSNPTVPFSKWQGRCDTHYKYLKNLPLLRFGHELDSHLKIGITRKLMPPLLKVLSLFTGIKVKGHIINE